MRIIQNHAIIKGAYLNGKWTPNMEICPSYVEINEIMNVMLVNLALNGKSYGISLKKTAERNAVRARWSFTNFPTIILL